MLGTSLSWSECRKPDEETGLPNWKLNKFRKSGKSDLKMVTEEECQTWTDDNPNAHAAPAGGRGRRYRPSSGDDRRQHGPGRCNAGFAADSTRWVAADSGGTTFRPGIRQADSGCRPGAVTQLSGWPALISSSVASRLPMISRSKYRVKPASG